MTENMTSEVETTNRLSKIARQKYGDNAVEALVGALSTVVTLKQLEVLCNAWSSNE